MSDPVIKIYGERNTGTNYLQQLLRANFKVEVLPGGHPEHRWPFNATFSGSEMFREMWHFLTFRRNLGWKHTAIAQEKFIKAFSAFPGLRVIFLLKNPYSWIVSLHRRPYHSPSHLEKSLGEFVEQPWRTLRREHLPRVVDGPAQLWQMKVASYQSIADKIPSIAIRYEDLLRDPEAVVAGLGKELKLPVRGQWRNIEASAKGDIKGFSDYRDYYLNERWKGDLTPEITGAITRRLEAPTLERFGYQVL